MTHTINIKICLLCSFIFCCRYVELIEKDTIKFGFSSRDYVILHDNMETSPEGADGVD